jgi:hypothetical protein
MKPVRMLPVFAVGEVGGLTTVAISFEQSAEVLIRGEENTL